MKVTTRPRRKVSIRRLTEQTAPEGTGVYMLQCSDGSLYTGAAVSIARRLTEHRSGRASRYTRSRLPVRLVYMEITTDYPSALRREFAIKNLSRAAKMSLIQSFFPQ